MSLWLIAAFGFLALSFLLMFAWPVAVYGREALADMTKRAEARLLAGGVATLAASALFTPVFVEALISSGGQALTLAEGFNNLSWGL